MPKRLHVVIFLAVQIVAKKIFMKHDLEILPE
jgi:hypothetical protein